MSLTYDQAYDEILTIFKEGWDTTGHIAFYEDVEAARLKTNAPYAKVEVNFGESRQTGFGGDTTGVGKLFTRRGDFRCYLFTLAGKGLSESLPLVKVVVDSFEGKHSPGGVWFKTVNTEDIGRSGAFRVTDIAVFFEFDERK